MRLVSKCVCAFAALALAGCGAAKPDEAALATELLSGLNETERGYLFADDASNGAFFGQPIDGGPIGCYPQRMNQAYVFVDNKEGLWIDSVRPTSVERHKIKKITSNGGALQLSALNEAGAPFVLRIDRLGNDRASISWDGTIPSTFQRCEKPND